MQWDSLDYRTSVCPLGSSVHGELSPPLQEWVAYSPEVSALLEEAYTNGMSTEDVVAGSIGFLVNTWHLTQDSRGFPSFSMSNHSPCTWTR